MLKYDQETHRVHAPRVLVQALILMLIPLLGGCNLPIVGSPASGCGKGYPDRVLGPMTYSPDGNMLAVGYSGTCGGEVEVWDMRNPGQPPVVLPGHAEEVESLSFSGDSKLLAYAGSRGDGVARVIDTSNLGGKPVELGGHDDDVRSLVISADGLTLYTLDVNNTLRVWDLANPTPTRPKATIQIRGLTNELALSPDGQTLAIAGYLSTDVELRDIADLNTPATVLHGVLNPYTAPVFSPDGRYLAIGASTANVDMAPLAALNITSDVSAVELWDLSAPGTGPLLLLGNSGNAAGGVAFSPDGMWLANTKVGTGLVEVWDMTDISSADILEKAARVWYDDPARVFQHDAAYSTSFSTDGKTLASGSMYTSIMLWDYSQPSSTPTILADPPPSRP